MKFSIVFLIVLHAFVYYSKASLQDLVTMMTPTYTSPGCISFSPYVNGLTPNWGPGPNESLITTLLQDLKAQTTFRCIMIYDLSGIHVITVRVAQQLGIKILGQVYIDPTSLQINNIGVAIQTANAYRDTIYGISCGSEVAYGNNNPSATQTAVLNCRDQLIAGGVTQPIGYIDIATVWCNGELPCTAQYELGNLVDFIGIDEFPWWENTYSKAWPCESAQNAPNQTIYRYNLVKKLYPGKTVMLTEHGWPGSNVGNILSVPNQFYPSNQCGVANRDLQREVNQKTIALCATNKIPCNLFSAFDESWKGNGNPYDVNNFWGIIAGTPPYQSYAPTSSYQK